jgi:2'-5' RNA ligase
MNSQVGTGAPRLSAGTHGVGRRARLFVALWPDPDIRAQLSRRRDAWRWPAAAKPVADDRLHLTLHFIGAFGRTQIAALDRLLKAVALEPATLRACDEEVWRGGIAVLRFAGDSSLAALHRRLGAVLADLGVTVDPRPFSPHVTVARRARGAERPADPAAIEWRADTFALVESLGVAGTGYRVLQSYGIEWS